VDWNSLGEELRISAGYFKADWSLVARAKATGPQMFKSPLTSKIFKGVSQGDLALQLLQKALKGFTFL